MILLESKFLFNNYWAFTHESLIGIGVKNLAIIFVYLIKNQMTNISIVIGDNQHTINYDVKLIGKGNPIYSIQAIVEDERLLNYVTTDFNLTLSPSGRCRQANKIHHRRGGDVLNNPNDISLKIAHAIYCSVVKEYNLS